MKSKYANIVIIFVIMVVCTLSMGHAAFGTEMSIARIVSDIRIEKNVRVTGVSLKSANNGSINYVEYDADSILGNVNLKSFTSTVTLQVSVTNFGNEEMGIWDITGLPDNLYKTISGYEMKTKLCDQSGSCSLGSITTFDITLGYDTYDAVTKDHEFRLDFEFRKMHKITYTGITNNNYPTSVIDGGNLTFTAISNIPPKIVAFTATGDRYDYDLYSYANNKFNFENVSGDVVLKYKEKVYLGYLGNDEFYKESAYKTVIDSVYFVDYVDTSAAIVTYDLSNNGRDKDIIGWITTGNDLYIGSEWNVYSRSLEKAFYGMSGIKTISFGGLNTSEVTNMYYMFKDCSSLLSLDVSSFDTGNVTNMGRMFEGLNKITSLNLSNFNTSKVEKMHGMFRDMSALVSLDISSFDTSAVNTMYEMFSYTSSLNSLILSHFSTSKVTRMDRMFMYCTALAELDVSSFDTSNVVNMMYMFYHADSLVNLDLSNFNTANVENMYGTFQNMNKLETINLKSFNTSKVTTMEWMFHYSTKLTSLDLSSFDTSNVVDMRGMMGGLNQVTSINVSNFNTSKVKNMNSMFSEQWKIKELDLSSFDMSSVTSATKMFSNDHSLCSLKFNNATFDTVDPGDKFFYNVRSGIYIVAKDDSARTWLQDKLGTGKGTIVTVAEL